MMQGTYTDGESRIVQTYVDLRSRYWKDIAGILTLPDDLISNSKERARRLYEEMQDTAKEFSDVQIISALLADTEGLVKEIESYEDMPMK